LSERAGRAESIPPSPADLIESIRGFGYTLPTALADLVDNSLAASAKCIDITIDAAIGSDCIALVDDGEGMTRERLVEAMRMGTLGPLASREATDLGRFGLGLKTASLSQGRSLTVATKRRGDSGTTIRRWDLDHVRRAADWQLLDNPTDNARHFIQRLDEWQSGTAVIIEKLDRSSFCDLTGAARQADLARCLEAVREHLGMVFHRFIVEDGLVINLGNARIPAWDPFMRALSTCLPAERLSFRQAIIEVTPYVLPHHSKISDDQHKQASGPRGWNKQQGFYIYRCRRLIVPGNWLGSGQQEEHMKLARIQVDLPNNLDTEWQLNVMKSHVAAPAALRDDFRRIAADVRRQASAVYRVRGETSAPDEEVNVPVVPVWRRKTCRTGVRFVVNRSHPVIQALLHAGCGHDRLLNEAISLFEGTIPVAAMLQEPQKAIDGSVHLISAAEIDSLAAMVLHTEQFYIRAGRPPSSARSEVLAAEPFRRFREQIIQAIEAKTSAPMEPNHQ